MAQHSDSTTIPTPDQHLDRLETLNAGQTLDPEFSVLHYDRLVHEVRCRLAAYNAACSNQAACRRALEAAEYQLHAYCARFRPSGVSPGSQGREDSSTRAGALVDRRRLRTILTSAETP